MGYIEGTVDLRVEPHGDGYYLQRSPNANPTGGFYLLQGRKGHEVNVCAREVPALVAWLRQHYPHAFESPPRGESDWVLSKVRQALATPEGANIIDHAQSIYKKAHASRVQPETQVCSAENGCGSAVELRADVAVNVDRTQIDAAAGAAKQLADDLERAARALAIIKGCA